MTDQEQLAGYDDDGTDRTPALRLSDPSALEDPAARISSSETAPDV
jgi:hypothetical protein